MDVSTKLVGTIDYRKPQASTPFVPNAAVLSSSGWEHLYLELHRQPSFEIAEHQYTMHVLAIGLADAPQEQTLARGERWIDGKCIRESRPTGSVAIMPAGLTHRCNWQRTAQFGILAIEPSLLQQIGQDWVNPDTIELMPQFMNQPDAFIQGIFTSLRSEIAANNLGSPLMVDSLKTALAIYLLRHACVTSPPELPCTNGLSPAQLTIVKDYIHADGHRNIQLKDLSQIVQISPYHFLRLFKQSTGLTPHQYILQARLKQAQQLLKSSHLSIATIATQTGFADQSHLTRSFQRQFGLTPKQFRQNVCQNIRQSASQFSSKTSQSDSSHP